jgi:WhiB family redox-sensing transcriptional regulator
MSQLTRQRDDWATRAACQTADPDVFFPISATAAADPVIRAARAVCARCPVRGACAEFALEHRELQGIWGGTTEDERRRLRRAQAREQAARQPAEAGTAA